MTTPSRYLGLAVPTRDDQFSTADLAANWGKIDEAPGTLVCTSSTRPTWGSSQAGRRIYETDSDLEWIWDGTAFQRAAPKGLLKKTNGEWAIAERTTSFSSMTVSEMLVLGVNDVVVPPGRRTLMIQVVWSRAYNSNGYFYGRIMRSSTPSASGQGTIVRGWSITGDYSEAREGAGGGGGTVYALETNGLAPGIYSWSFQIALSASILGTATVQGNPTSPTEISVMEI